MRIQVSDPSRCGSLRDYFLRLGAVAVVVDGSCVDVHFPNDPINQGESVEAYLRSWVELTDVAASVASEAQPQTRLGDLLVSKGFISREQLAYAVVEAREQGELLGRLLLRYEWIFESELARTLAEQWGLPYLNLASIGVNRELIQLLPREVGARAAAVPVRRVDGATQVAFADPTDAMALAAVREFFPEFVPAVAELSDIENAWRSLAPAPPVSTDQPLEQAPAPEPQPSGRPKIGELFLEKGLLTRRDLEDALEEQKTTRKPLGEILVNRRLIDRMHLASALSTQWSAQRPIQSNGNGSAPEQPQQQQQQQQQPQEQLQEQPQEQPPAVELEHVEVQEPPQAVEDPEVGELLRAVAQLTTTVERLRAEVAALSTRSPSGGAVAFSGTTL
jgi:Type II secretion system (T2SS), protein E, N-terminal domain